MGLPRVSVIIVNCNGAKYLPACFSALSRQTYPHIDVIIVDNASSDNSCHLIEAFRAQLDSKKDYQSSLTLKLIRNESNEGFCRGNNQGIHASCGEFVLLLNADVKLDCRFVEILVKTMQSDSTIGITLGKLLSAYDPKKVDSTGITIHKTRRAYDRGQREDDAGQYNVVEEVFGASGAACFYRRTMLDSVSYHGEYLDELFFAYKEDIDLSWRARLLGWKCVYTPEAIGWHYRKWGTGKRKDIPKWIRRHSLKNRYLMMLKNDCRRTLSPHIFPLLWYECRSILYILFREPYLLAVIGDIIREWPKIMQKRRFIQKASGQKEIENILSWFQ